MNDFKTKPISKLENLKENPRVMTFGTFDLLHKGHLNIFFNILKITKENKMFIGVSSDSWNNKKNKTSHEPQDIRLENIQEVFKESTVFFEDHDTPEETWPELFDKYNIDFILMGGDHSETLNYINEKTTPKGKKMKIVFFERTKGISSTMLREAMKNEK